MKDKSQHIFYHLGGFASRKHHSDDNFLILRTLRMVFKGVAGVKNVRTLKNVSKDYLHEVKKGREEFFFLSFVQPPQEGFI